jgi:hemolysin III
VTAVDSVAPATPVKPLLRGWMHLVWFEACLVLGTLALARTHGALRLTGLAIFVATLCAMFGVSAFYHRGNWSEAWRLRLQRVDHAMIFLLIAGTATPAFLIASHGVFRIAALAALWGLTVVAGAIHMVWMDAPELLVGSTFVALGWAGGLALPAVWLHSGAAPGALLLAGGLLYTAGALSYRFRWPNPSPAVFGFHEVFHVFVCAAATCQFAAIAVFIA